MNQYLDNINLADKYINKFIHRSKRFVDYTAFSYGAADQLRRSEPNNKYTYDHEYFNFTKSTKSLISIRALLKLKNNEDAMILVRSIFECYLSSRYLNENEAEFEHFTLNLYKVGSREYILNDDGQVVDRDGNIIQERMLMPKDFKIGLDTKYFFLFYDLLSKISHSNFGTVNLYRNRDLTFSYDKDTYPLTTRFFILFVFTKLFECIVTVEGEEFSSPNEEKKCYQLVKESLLFQQKLIKFILIEIDYDNSINPSNKQFNKKMKEMFKAMNKSLQEPLGSLKKDFMN